MLRTTDTHRAFEALARVYLARHPEIAHAWCRVRGCDGGRTDLVCWPHTAREVFASLTHYQITIGSAAGATDFEDFGRGLGDQDLAAQAFARFLDLLSANGVDA